MATYMSICHDPAIVVVATITDVDRGRVISIILGFGEARLGAHGVYVLGRRGREPPESERCHGDLPGR